MASFKFTQFEIAHMVHEWSYWDYEEPDRTTDNNSNQYLSMKTYHRHVFPRGRLTNDFKSYNHCRQMLRASIRGILVNRSIPLRRVKKLAAIIKGLLKTQLSEDIIRYILTFL